MKNTFLILMVAAFLALISTILFTYAHNGYGFMMGGYMMSRGYQNQNNYSSSVSSYKLSNNAQKGEALFQSLCASCHGQYAQGNIGPNIQGASIQEIHWALNNVAMMKSLKSNPSLNANSISNISDFLHEIRKQ